MKIAVISDVHGNLHALESIVKDIHDQKVDHIAFLGDLIMTGPRPVEVLQLLSDLQPDVWIKGNTDDWLSELDDVNPTTDYEKLLKEIGLWASEKLTEKQRQELIDKKICEEKRFGNFNLAFCHGTPKSYSNRILPDSETTYLRNEFEDLSTNIIICGHTHLRFSLNHNNGTIKNFGSVSIPISDHSKYAKYGIIHIGDNIGFEDRDCDYDLQGFIRDIDDVKYPGKSMILPKYGIG